jgi:hypothetical protein
MDPNETLRLADQAISDCDVETAREYLEYYQQWRMRGGFEPLNVASSGKRGDTFSSECQRRLGDLERALVDGSRA